MQVVQVSVGSGIFSIAYTALAYGVKDPHIIHSKCSTSLKISYFIHSIIAYVVRSNTWLTCEK